MEYEGTRRVSYEVEGEGEMVFIPVCAKCGRFVKADGYIDLGEFEFGFPNATCSKCERVGMIFEGWF